MRRAVGGVLMLWLAVVGLAGCSHEEPPVFLVAPTQISVFNRTDHTWKAVDVWLNDHYRVQAPELLPGGRLDIPIRTFVAGWGQHFDTRRQVPFGIEVDAKDSTGQPVRLVWGKGRRR
jgi:hypothetical protein